MSVPKLHHYVPQFHLQRFTNETGKLWAWDRDADHAFPTTTTSIAAETYFYRLSQYEELGHDWTAMEKQFSELEGNVSIITNQWLEWLRDAEPRAEIPIPDTNREIVSLYLALQHLRTAEMRQLLSLMMYEDTGTPLTKADERRMHTELLWSEETVTDLATRFQCCVWMFARNCSEVPLITSDNPVAFRTHDNQQWRKLGGILNGTYAVFPMAPDIVLYCFPNQKPWAQKIDNLTNRLSPVLLDAGMVQSENSGQVFMATRYVFACRNDFRFENEFASSIGTDLYKPK